MKYQVSFARQAESDLKVCRAYDRTAILDVVERVLTTTPEKLSKSRIKRLRGTDSPMYRLRVDEFRVFYDVDPEEHVVLVLRVLSKDQSIEYLREVIGHEVEDDQL